MSVLCFKVNSYIEDCIAQKHPLIKVLRLICLQSVCNSGLKQKVLDYYKREILQVSIFLNYQFAKGENIFLKKYFPNLLFWYMIPTVLNF